MSTRNRIDVDIAIVGGGITGLWLLNLLRIRGYSVVLIERSAFGDGQTIASQGIIHGGLKYALGGALTKSSEALAAMPARWRRCLQGLGEVDLRGAKVLSDRYYFWSNDTSLGRLRSFFASKLLHGRIRRLPQAEWVPPFDTPDFSGAVYELAEVVLDATSVLERLAASQGPFVLRGEVSPHVLLWGADGALAGIRVGETEISAQRYVLAAGTGNGDLLAPLRVTGVAMQRLGLQQVIARGPGLVPLYAHCIHGVAPAGSRLTITSHIDASGSLLWYLGGQLASEGAHRSPLDQIDFARRELKTCLPWLNLAHLDLETMCIDRAEPQSVGGIRQGDAFVARAGNVFVCWPTKLTLVPNIADQLLGALDVAPSWSSVVLPAATELAVAATPWDR